ncbi:MAG: hypothetical protein ACXVDW_20475, partial [Bacteroidia bacterium]
GPGYRFEIDATKLQVKIVSRFDRSKIIGTPTLYIIVDVWSGAIVGYSLSIENASWALAATALYNCFTPKQKIFERLELPYTDNDWPCHHLPTNLAADRGEFISTNADTVPEVGINLEIMPAMRPDRKGKVESEFKNIKHGKFYKIPGSYAKYPKRREPNGNNSAVLTLKELEIIIVDIILDVNSDPVNKSNLPTEFLEEDTPDVTHIGLHNWGLKNKIGFTRIMPEKDVFTNFLNKEKGSVTPSGIKFKSFFYSCNELIQHGSLMTANNGHYTIEIRYHPHIADCIWFCDKFSNSWILAEITDIEIKRLKTIFLEIDQKNKKAESLTCTAFEENVKNKYYNDNKIKLITDNAQQEAKVANYGKTKTEKNSNIRKNKSIEKESDRIQNGNEITSYVKAINNRDLNISIDNKDDIDNTIEIINEILNVWDKI